MSVSPSALVMSYAPRCGHCMAIKSATGMGQDIPGTLVAVDTMKETELCRRLVGVVTPLSHISLMVHCSRTVVAMVTVLKQRI